MIFVVKEAESFAAEGSVPEWNQDGMYFGGMPSAEQYQHQEINSTLNRKNIILKNRRRKNGRRRTVGCDRSAISDS
ncbi:unnamed protein product [Cylindrotheca closterium]|uniref:Uncharacterized protein n=1 Tax=Cylindrotheca closterium TaxID=2856 RepID=A0AAD2FIM8_9STRA|nr:unnamed protein product [Cylindrotheca closterium]